MTIYIGYHLSSSKESDAMNDHQPRAADKPANANGGAAAHAQPVSDRKEARIPQSAGAAEKDVPNAKHPAVELLDQATTAAGDALTSMAENLGEQAQDMARRIGDQTTAGTRAAGDYLSRRTGANPLAALLIAGAIGYAVSYLVHRH